MNTKQDYIAVLDSGLGGLSVLRHLRRRMPGERFVYYGDSAHAPYGTRSHAEVEALTMNAAAHHFCDGVLLQIRPCPAFCRHAQGVRYAQAVYSISDG